MKQRVKHNTDISNFKKEVEKLPTVNENIGLNDPEMKLSTRQYYIGKAIEKRKNTLEKRTNKINKLIKQFNSRKAE